MILIRAFIILQVISAIHMAHAETSTLSVRFVPEALPPVSAGERVVVAAVVRNDIAGESIRNATLSLSGISGMTVSPRDQSIRLHPRTDTPAFFTLTFSEGIAQATKLTALIDGWSCRDLSVGECYDLEGVNWKSKWDKDKIGEVEGWMKAEYDDSSWDSRSLPSLWNEAGITWLRANLYIPKSWKGRNLFLSLKAVDDCDVCYLNGVKVGATDGWDVPRNYIIDPAAVHYGEDNLLVIAVHNISYGGGVYRSPSRFGVAQPEEPAPEPVSLGPSKPIGKPLPLRPMIVRDGVLFYEDGGEVALWGVNYYPQSWYQYDNMKRLGVDMKKAIRDDLDDMKKMGVEIIRIHVFDREISDGEGNLLDNEHLDLLDYLIAEATKRDLYFMFTPIAWWGGPNENPDSFSARTPKEYMFCDDAAIRAGASYMKNWMNHVNRYTHRPYHSEPAICVFEIMNEPVYVDYNILHDPDRGYYPVDPVILAPFKARQLEKWKNWCAAHGLGEDKRFYPLFRYSLMWHYLNTMVGAIRETGARQPVACGLFDAAGQEDLLSAISDSPCDGVTVSVYAGDWDKSGDHWNYLPWAKDEPLSPKLNRKVRLVYEFDGIKTFGSYFYPALARRFRNQGVQIACMFQYDSRVTAEWNTDWDAHYLNWLYTPGKAVSFLIGGRVFHDLERGETFPAGESEQVIGRGAVSFNRNVSLYASPQEFLNTGPAGDWRPLEFPRQPRLLAGVGDSPFVRYSGTGIYCLNIDYPTRRARLLVNPDARIVGDPWHPSKDKSAVVLEEGDHEFSLLLPNLQIKNVVRLEADGTGRRIIEVKENTFKVKPGEYVIKW